MRKIVLFLLLCGLPILDFAQDSLMRGTFCGFQSRKYDHDDYLCDNSPWILVFEDDFLGSELDTSTWNIGMEGGSCHLRYGNHEQQYYTQEGNCEVSDGKLNIVAKEVTPFYARAVDYKNDDEILSYGILNLREFKYTSCNVETKRKFSFGRFEARVKLPKGKGFWPAFWLYGGKFHGVERYNELDIFEFMNEKTHGVYEPELLSKVHIMTSHFEVDSICHCTESQNHGIDFSQSYNDFRAVWDKKSTSWYVNAGLKFEKYKLFWWWLHCRIKEGKSYYSHITHPEDPMSLILNLAIQGNEADTTNAPDSSTPFPGQMQVDWVRVWYRMKEEDVVIDSMGECVLDNELFNAVTGNNVTINCDYVVPKGQQLSLSASGDVILKSGFVTETGSVFNARSKRPIDDDKYVKGNEGEPYFDELPDDSVDEQIADNYIPDEGSHLSANGPYSVSNGLYVYPNPNNGRFRIQLPSSFVGKCSVSITDTNGCPVLDRDVVAADNISIDISSFPQGIYLLHVVSADSEYNNLQKIVIL